MWSKWLRANEGYRMLRVLVSFICKLRNSPDNAHTLSGAFEQKPLRKEIGAKSLTLMLFGPRPHRTWSVH